jgi:hypothetical protein
MLSPEEVIKQVESITLLNQETNIFICHSNLHALQVLSLQSSGNNICLYNEAVSIKFLEKNFNGKLFAFSNEIKFAKRQLYPFQKLFYLKNKKLNAFLGNKHNYWSTFIINQLAIKNISILDDGLSSYGVSQELYFEKNVVKKIGKKIVKHLLSAIGWQFFHESNNAEISRQCKAYYFFPDLVNQPSCVTKIQLDDKVFHYYSRISPVTLDNSIIHIASFEESKRINREGIESENVSYILHPRIVGKSAEIPAEILLYRSDKVSLSASSLILYLVFIGYKGEYIFKDGDEESNKILSFFTMLT